MSKPNISADKVGPEPEKNLLQQALDEQIGDELDTTENKKIREIFFKFLEERGAFADYSKNLENYHSDSFMKKFIILQEKNKPESYVDFFSWKATGKLNYWFKIREQWIEYLQKLQNKTQPKEQAVDEQIGDELEPLKI